ncbi:hypothetical protein HDV01_002174 [Terramyces sp. JEL0728]|nr:hypothetical protein HDV01_002174 [Terramyces sp. JEL0728]
MLFHKQKNTIPHAWSDVTLAVWKKYPNPFASHVLSADVIDRYVDSQGILHSTRLFLKKGKIPSWGAALIKIPEAYILETSSVNPKTKEMVIHQHNLSHTKLLLIKETLRITEMESITKLKNSVTVISNTGFTPIRERLEKFGLSRFEQNTLNSFKGLIHVLENRH